MSKSATSTATERTTLLAECWKAANGGPPSPPELPSPRASGVSGVRRSLGRTSRKGNIARPIFNSLNPIKDVPPVPHALRPSGTLEPAVTWVDVHDGEYA